MYEPQYITALGGQDIAQYRALTQAGQRQESSE